MTRRANHSYRDKRVAILKILGREDAVSEETLASYVNHPPEKFGKVIGPYVDRGYVDVRKDNGHREYVITEEGREQHEWLVPTKEKLRKTEPG